MEEEFLKKFVGKQVAVLPFGGSLNAGIRGKVASVDGAILHLVDDDDSIYIDIDGIMAIIPFGEAVQDEN
jgi:hypothetical protein